MSVAFVLCLANIISSVVASETCYACLRRQEGEASQGAEAGKPRTTKAFPMSVDNVTCLLEEPEWNGLLGSVPYQKSCQPPTFK